MRIGGDWTASNRIADAIAGPDGRFGTEDDAPLNAGSTISKIASILIKGIASGTTEPGDHFGFVAHEIGAFKSGGAKLTLSRGAHNDLTGFPLGTTRDLTVREVA